MVGACKGCGIELSARLTLCARCERLLPKAGKNRATKKGTDELRVVWFGNWQNRFSEPHSQVPPDYDCDDELVAYVCLIDTPLHHGVVKIGESRRPFRRRIELENLATRTCTTALQEVLGRHTSTWHARVAYPCWRSSLVGAQSRDCMRGSPRIGRARRTVLRATGSSLSLSRSLPGCATSAMARRCQRLTSASAMGDR